MVAFLFYRLQGAMQGREAFEGLFAMAPAVEEADHRLRQPGHTPAAFVRAPSQLVRP
jgi:hypothetical protein